MANKPSKSNDPNSKMIARNRRARHDYEILDELECGIVLRGSEVKSLRDGKVSLEEAYAKIHDNELWLLGCDIAEYPQANLMNHDPRRERKLLIHRRELKKFAAAAEIRGQTLIPLAMYFSEGRVKVEIAWLIARHVSPHTPLFVANSMPARDVEYVWPPNDRAL